MKWRLALLFLFIEFVLSGKVIAQSEVIVSKPNYPYVKAYMSFIIPWVTINKDETVTEFEQEQKTSIIGFPYRCQPVLGTVCRLPLV